jgi:hypothetical protein
MHCFRLFAVGVFALATFALSGSPTAAQEKSSIGARVKTHVGPVVLQQTTAKVEMKSPVEGFAITIKREGKTVGTMALPRDRESRVYLTANRYKRVKEGSITRSVFSDGVVFRLEKNGKQVLELTADEITLQVTTPAE